MTPQEQRNRRFDEKFGGEGVIAKTDENSLLIAFTKKEVKDFLTSEVHLTIEQVEKWAESKEIPIPRFATELENDIWKNGYETILVDLLTFLTTLKK